MNPLSRFTLFSLLVLLSCNPAAAQTATDDSTPETPTAGQTIITSDELHSDQTTHISVFTGNVIVLGNNFKMTCQEMTVYFTADNKIDKIVSTGNVVITQPGRVTHCGHAEYFHDEDKFDLTDQPIIVEPKQKLSGPEIIIFRTTQKLITPKGERVELSGDSMSSPKPAATTTTPDDK
jgi:lipopolysaccharide transport protein LptA